MPRSYTVLVPVYNEAPIIYAVLKRLVETVPPIGWSRKMVVVNDGSTDHSLQELDRFVADFPEVEMRVIHCDENRGKGAAFRQGLAVVQSEYVLIQDGDWEYDPADHALLLAALVDDPNRVVYGSRFLRAENVAAMSGRQRWGNRVLTRFANWRSGLSLTDMETCYKLMPVALLRQLTLVENDFRMEPEITLKLAKLPQVTFVEVPISYAPRKALEGKKINWKDGVRGLRAIARH